jgi:hypothetical protein
LATQLDVYNQAMGKIGQQRVLTALGENSVERIQCDRYYEVARQASLRDWDWPFARKFDALVATTGTTNSSAWTYEYTYPTDCLAPRRIKSGEESTVPHPPNVERIPFEVATTSTGASVIYTNEASATLVYTFDVTDASGWTADFVDALGWKLAWYLAVSIAGSEKWAQSAAQGYVATLMAARVASSSDERGRLNRDKDSEYGSITQARF